MKLTEPQRSLLGWIERRDTGNGSPYLPRSRGTMPLIRRLEAKGAIERGVGKHDPSIIRWRITAAGRAALEGREV